MIAWEKHVKVWQLVGAVLAVPAGIAGTYGAYRSYISGGVSCPDLRSSIIATLERNISPETKRTLLHEAVDEFDRHCAQKYPDARVIFDAAMSAPPLPRAAPAGPAARDTTVVAPSSAIFGLSRSGERRGWVAMVWRDTNHEEQANFDDGGIPILSKSPPAAGAIVTARRRMAVWLEPQTNNDPSLLQGGLAEGACVRILSVRPATLRLWAEVAPEACK